MTCKPDLETFADSNVPEPEYRPEDEIVIGETYPTNAETTQENHPINRKTIQKKVGRTAQQIIDCLIEDPGLTREKLAEKLGRSDSTIKEHMGKLQALEIIQRVGANKNGYWKVLIKK